MPAATELEVLDQGQLLRFGFEDLMRYHGGGSPGGVAHAFKIMERAFPLLASGQPPERRAVTVRTAFGGPGARDGFELVTRAVGEGRYAVDSALARSERGLALERFVFELGYRSTVVTLLAREGTVPEELITLARKSDRSAAEQTRLERVKRETARQVMARTAQEAYDVEVAGG